IGIFLFIESLMRRGDLMEVKIRDVNFRAIKVLDDQAKKHKVSRNTLLKRIVEDKVTFDGIKGAEKELDVTMNRVVDALEVTYQRLKQLEKQTMKMYLLLCDGLGMDPTEAEGILEKTFDMEDKKTCGDMSRE